MRYKIEKNTVQETLIIPLYARKMCSELYPNLYRDEAARRLVNAVDYDFSALEKKSRNLMQRFGFLEVAMRQNDLAYEVRDYLKTHPTAAVVNLGCGLDCTGRACDNGHCKIYNLDFPDVIAVRNQLLPAGERETNIPCDLNDTAWFDKIDASGGAVFFASGVFYYFMKEQVRIGSYYSAEQTVLVHHLRDHLLTNREGYISLASLAAEHEISVSHLQKLFKQVYGVPIYRYIKEYRLEQAAVELVRSGKSVTEIAQQAGYDNASKFSESFKKRYGKTPSRYRADKKNAVKRSIKNKTE